MLKHVFVASFLVFHLSACATDDLCGGGSPCQEGSEVEAETTGISDATELAGETDATLGQDQTIVAFDDVHVFFGSENKRTVDSTVSFPALEQAFQKVTLHFRLKCPSHGGCDHWDRKGWLGLVQNAGTDAESVMELWRFITPYRVAVDWTHDMTDLRPLLAGDVQLRVFIDTWVGPGHSDGAGWLVDLDFEFEGGFPERIPLAVIPVWTARSFEYGNPEKPTDTVYSESITLPEGVNYGSLRLLITGHGQGNAEYCAEFCPKNHYLTVENQAFSERIWRNDCAVTAASGQYGNYASPRAGWCPGAYVRPWTVDVSSQVAGKSQISVDYGVEAYENTCLPGAEPCTGCVYNTGCDYNGGTHTQSHYLFSGLLTVYR
ncbi:MAG: peptide-N-glycosidase F-related protein [Myxococcota bacterium]|nr:peptide-N-glycosidase F-related protein [Myxococcota bacterium]